MLLLAGTGPAACQMLHPQLDLPRARGRGRKRERAHIPSPCPLLPRCREYHRAGGMQVIRGMRSCMCIWEMKTPWKAERPRLSGQLTQVWVWRGDGGTAAGLMGPGFVSTLLSIGRARERGQKNFLECPPQPIPKISAAPSSQLQQVLILLRNEKMGD